MLIRLNTLYSMAVMQRQPSRRGAVTCKVGAANAPGSVVNDLALSRDCHAVNVEDALTPPAWWLNATLHTPFR